MPQTINYPILHGNDVISDTREGTDDDLHMDLSLLNLSIPHQSSFIIVYEALNDIRVPLSLDVTHCDCDTAQIHHFNIFAETRSAYSVCSFVKQNE